MKGSVNMKQIIPFKKELPFKTKVSEITSISLEREIKVEDEGVVTGVFHITGDYKMNEGSINRENFSFDLPFDITLDPRYDVSTVTSDIEDFYYDVLNEDTLKVNIDLYVEAEYLPEKETKEEEERITEEEPKVEEPEKVEIQSIPSEEEDMRSMPSSTDEIKEEPVKQELVREEKEEVSPVIPSKEPEEKREDDDRLEIKKIVPPQEDTPKVEGLPDFAGDLFSNLDDTETYTTYYVYIVKEEDTIDKILVKYGVTKEDLEAYNDIAEIKPGDKIIVPKTSE